MESRPAPHIAPVRHPHAEMKSASRAQIEPDHPCSEALRSPPARQTVRLGKSLPHAFARRIEYTRDDEFLRVPGRHADTSAARRSSDWLQPCSMPARYRPASAAITFETLARSVSSVLPPCSQNV